MQKTRRCQAIRQGAQPRFWLIQVMQHPHRVDVVERSFLAEIQEVELLLAQRAHLLSRSGALTAFPRHRQGPSTDIYPEHIRTRV